MFDTTHFHITAWVLGLVLFFAAAFGVKNKAIHMILRLFYIIIIVSGFGLFLNFSDIDQMLYGMKLLFGILTIGMMEMVLVKQKKGKKTSLFWILFIVFLLVTLFLGFKLPIGFDFFA